MKNNYALVLAGGGGKCSYQIGAWKAFKEMDIEFDMISSVSMGAINGAFICADDYDSAIKMWKNTRPQRSMKVADILPNQDYVLNPQNWKALATDFIKNKGFDLSLTPDFLSQYVDEKKVRASETPFSIIITDRKNKLVPKQMFVEDIPQGQLVQYLLSSSNFLCSRDLSPDGEKFVDGGLHDNLPINFLRQQGYNKIIVLDTSEFKGFHHSLNINNAEIIYIRPQTITDLGQTFAFEPKYLDSRLTYGYLDAKKAFSHLLGKLYYFEPTDFRSMLDKYDFDVVDKIEDMANDLGVDRLKVYDEKEFMSSCKIAFDEFKFNQENNTKMDITKPYKVAKNIVVNKLKGVSYEKAVAVLNDYVI